MKKTRWIMCLMLVVVMLFGTVSAFAEEEATTTAAEATPEERAAEMNANVVACTDGEHTPSGSYVNVDDEIHSKECGTCFAQFDFEVHKLGKTDPTSFAKPCSICKSKVPVTAEEWAGEKNSSVRGCTKTDDGVHVPNGVYEELDLLIHCQRCTYCNARISFEAHNLGEVENNQRPCLDCGKKVDIAHEHGAAEGWKSNAKLHWHACVNTFGLRGAQDHGCLEKIEVAEHTFNDQDICTVCGAKNVIDKELPDNLGVKWIVLIVVFAVTVVAAVPILLINPKKKK